MKKLIGLMTGQEFNHNALVGKTDTLLDEVERVGDSWHSGKDSTESLRQLRILADTMMLLDKGLHKDVRAERQMGYC